MGGNGSQEFEEILDDLYPGFGVNRDRQEGVEGIAGVSGI
jgi:hypothetical protein